MYIPIILLLYIIMWYLLRSYVTYVLCKMAASSSAGVKHVILTGPPGNLNHNAIQNDFALLSLHYLNCYNTLPRTYSKET